MGVLPVAQVLRLLELHRVDVGEILPAVSRQDGAQPVGDGGVVAGRELEGLGGEREVGLLGDLAAGFLHLLEDLRVVRGVRDDADEAVVLRRRADHGRAADVDVLDGLLDGAAGLCHGVLEAVEIDDHHVDHLDAVRPGRLHVLLVVAKREQAPVDLRVQGLEPSVHHLRESRVGRDIGHVDPRRLDLGRRAARREDLDSEALQALRKLHDARLVGDAD